MPQSSSSDQTTLLRPRHIGTAVLFVCIDDYLRPFHNQLADNLDQPFLVSMGGGGLAFLLKATNVAACKQVEATCRITGPRELFLWSHLDCGAYRHFAGIDWERYSQEAQIATLWRDLRLAEAVIHQYLESANLVAPKLTVHLNVVDLHEKEVPEPSSFDAALDMSEYRDVLIPAAHTTPIAA